MYNEEIKNRYITEKQKETVLPLDYLKNIFTKSESFEEELDKDVSNFTYYEIENFYKTINFRNIDTLYVMNSAFAVYTTWCINHNLVVDSQNHFLEFTRSQLMTYVNKVSLKKQFVTRAQVLDWISQLPNPCDQFVMLGAFEGMSGKQYSDFIYAKVGDINGNEMTLHSGRVIHISDKLKEIAEESDQTMIYYAMTKGMEKQTKFAVGDTIIKEYPNTQSGISDFQKGRRIYNKYLRIFNFLGISWMTANTLAISGELEMTVHEAIAHKMTPREYIYSKDFKAVEEQYGKRIVKSSYWETYQEILESRYQEAILEAN